ncbi:MAG: DUF4340 domain-containing protein [Deltaproteobacteria bacterium]|nr:DUF4340 domain-containing protein [Deltaproteobacteria bacterium]
MKAKTLVILLVILVVLAVAGGLVIRSQDAKTPSGEMGRALFKGLPINDIAAVVIDTPTETASLKKTADFWIVEERFGYPADFSKLSDFVRRLREVKVGRQFEAAIEVTNRLALRAPDDAEARSGEKGTRIRMMDAEAKPLLDVVLGKTRIADPGKGPPDGQYLMVTGQPRIYLIDQIFSSFEVGPSQWLKKRPVQVDASEIRRIVCLEPDGATVRYAVKRPEKGKDFVWVTPLTDQKIKISSVNRLANALSSLSIEDVKPVSESPDFEKENVSARLDYTLFDGRVYHVYPARSCSPTVPCRIRLQVTHEPRTEETAGDASAQTRDASAKTGAGESAPAVGETRENEHLKPWVFIIPEWQHQAFLTNFEDLVEKGT